MHAAGVGGPLIIVAEQMKRPVYGVERRLGREGQATRLRLALGRVDRKKDIAAHRLARHCGVFECDHVGRTVVAQMQPVELSDPRIAHERDGNVGRTACVMLKGVANGLPQQAAIDHRPARRALDDTNVVLTVIPAPGDPLRLGMPHMVGIAAVT